MKVVLISMPDVVPIIIHEMAVHMPGHGIACVGGNIDAEHDVYLIDLIRKRRNIRRYLTRTLTRIRPELVGLSAMAWQYDTCLKLARLIKRILPEVKIVIGGYHATLMSEEIAASPEAALIDFLIRGEGEEACRRLVNALCGKDRLEEIPSLSYKVDGTFVHNAWGGPLDLSTLKLPIRDKRRLTWGYHILNSKIELIETSRGCTRACTFCSMKHMYGRTFRTYPIERVLADLDDIYYRKKVRWVFIVDDNMVLDPQRVMTLCDAIIARRYHKLNLVVQADCISISRNEAMVEKMARAGFRSVFLGIENVSPKNLAAARKGDIVTASQEAVEICHRHGIMVIGGLIFGFPDDDEAAIVNNYQFLNTIDADAAYCQILTPYPKTEMRRQLINQGLVTNPNNLSRYSGLWANVRTRHLSPARLQYLFWYHRQKVLGWWTPSKRVRSQGKAGHPSGSMPLSPF
ncbi:B12-binding domain-containing radical SAM protein [Desulfosarcina cetonica]|uniref:B12-binding domain-containing radical SAM protein n=1 Tax=Desulfosarcina cetonica TaxID=90730 RepID=UPI000AA6423B|nr:radical SAM protein [Desulfosarcina cetonica]